MGRVGKFLRLSSRDQKLVVSAALSMVRAAIGLRVLGFDRMRQRAQIPSRQSRGWCGPPPRRTVAPPPPERIAWAVRAVGVATPRGSNCLVRALATQAMLARYGYPSELKIGVRKSEDGAFAAHAWLECAGAVIIGDVELDSYTPMRVTPAAESRA
jgi:hypothetical protein